MLIRSYRSAVKEMTLATIVEVSPLLPALLLFFAPPESPGPLEDELKRFAGVFAVVETESAEAPPLAKAVYEGAIPGMLRRLDPHSVFFDQGQFEQLKELEKSTRKGFGTVVSVLPGRVIILQTMPGTPSARSGLSPGDEMLAVNGIALAYLEMEQIIGLLQQARQQAVRLSVRRQGSARLLEFTLTPEDVDAPSVERAFLLRPGVAYLRVGSFETETARQIKEAVDKLGGNQLNGLVLDLRSNQGGVFAAALETASLFLKPGLLIASVRGRSAEAKEIKVPNVADPYPFPISVLIGPKTASAAEIVAGALQDHDRASVLGEPSFGKGLVQSVYPLSNNNGLALTTAFYYTPSGRSIQKPLQGQLGEVTHAPRQEYKTASGRPIRGGGGIEPDRIVRPEGATQFRAVLEASGSFSTFATEYLQKNRVPQSGFEIEASLIDTFQVALSQRGIRTSVSEWSRELQWIRSRLKQEILNQAKGVAAGDEVEVQRDPQVLAALDSLGLR